MQELTMSFVIVPVMKTEDKTIRTIKLPDMKDVTETFFKSIESWCEPKGKLGYQYNNGNLFVEHKHPKIKSHFWGVKPTTNNKDLLKLFNSKVVINIKKTFPKLQINSDLLKKLTEVEAKLKLIEEKKTTEKMLKENEAKVKKAALPSPPKTSVKQLTDKQGKTSKAKVSNSDKKLAKKS